MGDRLSLRQVRDTNITLHDVSVPPRPLWDFTTGGGPHDGSDHGLTRPVP